MSPVIVFIIFVICLVIAIPVSISLGIVSVLPGAVDPSFTASATYVIRSMLGGLDSFPLLAVPMFVLSGIIMARGGISRKLFDVFAFFMGKRTAGMPCAVIVTCLFYGAISGSGPATVAAVGSMTIPILIEMGYDKKFMIAFILNRFHWFMDFVFKTVHAYWMSYYYAFIGLLGCNDAPLPLFALNFYSVMLFGSALIKTNNEEKTVCLKDKIIFVLIFLLTGLIILASVFILFQCYPLFCGVQGRYFIPVMPLFFLLFDNKRIVWNKFPILLILCILILIPFSVTTILNRFYL